jgi:hypothetical protein
MAYTLCVELRAGRRRRLPKTIASRPWHSHRACQRAPPLRSSVVGMLPWTRLSVRYPAESAARALAAPAHGSPESRARRHPMWALKRRVQLVEYTRTHHWRRHPRWSHF